jgi:chondroitin 4-sulfotransferase 11
MRAVFVHVSKCAGASMVKSLKEYDVYHCAPNRGPKWISQRNPARTLDFDDSCYSFGFVRNPFDRMVSAWKCPWVSHEFLGKSFLEFLYYIDKTDRKFAKSHVWSYLDPKQKLFDSESNDQRVSFIGRYENLQEDFDLVCAELSIPIHKLPHLHKGNRKAYQEYYNEESINIVSERYKRDLKYFNYEF